MVSVFWQGMNLGLLSKPFCLLIVIHFVILENLLLYILKYILLSFEYFVHRV